jgi:hypothetical protein
MIKIVNIDGRQENPALVAFFIEPITNLFESRLLFVTINRSLALAWGRFFCLGKRKLRRDFSSGGALQGKIQRWAIRRATGCATI